MSLPGIMWLKGAGIAALPSITFNTSTTTFTGTTTRTYSSVNIGTADSSRLVVVVVGNGNIALTGVTIGGITATKAIAHANSSGNIEMWYAAVSTGTTANVVVTSAINPGAESVGSFSLYNLSSNTPFNTNSSSNSSNSGITVTINTGSNGIIIAAAASDSPGSVSITTGQTLAYQFSFGGGCCASLNGGSGYASNQPIATGTSINFHYSIGNFSTATAVASSWH